MKYSIEACQFVWSANKLDIIVFRGDRVHRPVGRAYSANYDNLHKLIRLVTLGCTILNRVVFNIAIEQYTRNHNLISKNP